MSPSYFNLRSVFSLAEYVNLGEIFCPVRKTGNSSFSPCLWYGITSKSLTSMYKKKDQDSISKSSVLLCSLTHTSLCQTVSFRSSQMIDEGQEGGRYPKGAVAVLLVQNPKMKHLQSLFLMFQASS